MSRDGVEREGCNAINSKIDGQVVEQVNEFRYFGSLVSVNPCLLLKVNRRQGGSSFQ